MPELVDTRVIDRIALCRAVQKIYQADTNGSDAEVLPVVIAGTTAQALQAVKPQTAGLPESERLTETERLAFALFIVHREQALPRSDRHDFYKVIVTATIQSIDLMAQEIMLLAASRAD